MTLPPLALPAIPLPFEIPQMVHPVTVHFAIALPIIVLLLELINLFAKKRTIGVLSFFFMVLLAGVFVAAYLTGATDGKEAKAFLTAEAKETLAGHKQLGIYLVYASGLLMLFKLFSVLIRKTAIKVLFFLVLIVFTASVLNEGKKGGALVYQYGVNVKSVPAIANTAEPKVEQAAETKKEESTAVPTKSEEAALTPETEAVKTEPTVTEEAHPVAASTTEMPVHEGNVSH